MLNASKNSSKERKIKWFKAPKFHLNNILRQNNLSKKIIILTWNSRNTKGSKMSSREWNLKK